MSFRTPLSNPAAPVRPTFEESMSYVGETVPRRAKNMKKLCLSTAVAQNLSPAMQVSSSVPSTPRTARSNKRSPNKPPSLNMGVLGLSRRTSLPSMSISFPPETPSDSTFAVVRGLQADTTVLDGETELNGLNLYSAGPICVSEPNLWLYAEPSAKEVRDFDVVINVAKEIPDPLSTKSGHGTTMSSIGEDVADTFEASHAYPTLGDDSSDHGLTNIDLKSITKRYNGMEYVHIPWQHNQALANDLPVLTSYIDRNINVSNKRVLVHCQQGVSRSASLVIAFIMKDKAMDVNEAYAYVKKKAPGIGPNMSLIYQLCEWGKVIQSRSKPDYFQRRSFDVGGPKTAPHHRNSEFRILPRKRATSAVDRGVLERSKSDDAIKLPTKYTLEDSLSSTNGPNGLRSGQATKVHLLTPDYRGRARHLNHQEIEAIRSIDISADDPTSDDLWRSTSSMCSPTSQDTTEAPNSFLASSPG